MNKELTEIIFLLDRSGSMGGLESDTIQGFNTFIEKQAKLPGKTIVTTVLFDDAYEIVWNGIHAEDVYLTEANYFVRGMTALLDAIGKTILDVNYRMEQSKEEDRPGKVLFVITTDGLENASKEFSYKKVKHLIREQQEKAQWEFTFLGANIDASFEANQIGIKAENAINFEATADGLENMYEAVHCFIMDKRD